MQCRDSPPTSRLKVHHPKPDHFTASPSRGLLHPARLQPPVRVPWCRLPGNRGQTPSQRLSRHDPPSDLTTWGPVFTVNTKHYYLSLAWVSGKFRIGQIYECLFFIHIHRPGIVISLYVHWREGEVGGKEPDRHEPVATTGHVEGSIWDLIKWMNDLHRRYSIQ